MAKRTFQDIVEAAGYECRSYSGRAMYGESCLGVTLEPEHRIGGFVGDVVESISQPSKGHYYSELRWEGVDDTLEDLETVQSAFRKMRSDSMGLGEILYFPGFQFDAR